MTDCFFTVSSKTVNSIMKTADSFSALIVKSTVTSSKSVMIFKNAVSVLFQNIIIVTACSKAVSLLITVSTAILSMQLDSSSAESAENN